MGPPSKTSHLPPLQLSTGHVERFNSVKLLGITWMQIFRGSLMLRLLPQRQFRGSILSKTNQAFPKPSCSISILQWLGQYYNTWLQSGTICLPKHKLTKLKLYKGELSESSTATLATCLTLAHFIVLLFHLPDRRKHLARKFLSSVREPSSAFLASYLPPRDPSITTKMCKQVPSHPTLTRKYHTFISYALSHYRSAYS